MTSGEPAFACDMSAIDAADRPKNLATIEALFGSVQEMSELPMATHFGFVTSQTRGNLRLTSSHSNDSAAPSLILI